MFGGRQSRVADFESQDGQTLEIYQDSSGGENWRSVNHVNRQGRVPCRFPGCRVRTTAGDAFVDRASPVVVVRSGETSVGVSVPEFWQQFPKALEADRDGVAVGLFPGQWDDEFELQGGERKTHTVWLHFAVADPLADDPLDWSHHPTVVRAAPQWCAESGAIPYFLPAECDPDDRLQSLMQEAIGGPSSILAGREVIDEYGWRNYGDIWASHEAAYYQGPKPVISHYNNQFDPVYGAILQFLRTGDSRWAAIFGPLARHVMDIDIYHTASDRSTYSGGYFWHTDHYRSAGSATHRTYSRANLPANGSPYGGGPCCEQNYARGLLHYYFLTGDPDARQAALGLADWVIAMDDGKREHLRPVGRRPQRRGDVPRLRGTTTAPAGAQAIR